MKRKYDKRKYDKLFYKIVQCGRDIQLNLGEKIAAEFRNGSTLMKISERYDIANNYNLKPICWATNAVRLALAGWDDNYYFTNCDNVDVFSRYPKYFGLIPKEEYKKLAKRHIVDGQKSKRRDRQKNNDI